MRLYVDVCICVYIDQEVSCAIVVSSTYGRTEDLKFVVNMWASGGEVKGEHLSVSYDGLQA